MRFHQLDTLRFFFAFYIVLGHAIGWVGPLRHAGLAVDFFFMLSGFVLSHLIIQKAPTFGQFFVARLSRMWPLQVVMTIAVALVTTDVVTSSALFMNLTLLQDLGTLDRLYLDFPSWSISAEMIVGVCVFYPIVARRLSFVALGLSLLCFAVWFREPGSLEYLATEPVGPISIGLVRCSFGTLVGYLLYETLLSLGKLSIPTWMACSIHTVLLAGMFVAMGLPMDRGGTCFALALSAASILLLSAMPSPIVRLLSLPYIRWVGSLSFGVYMVHAFVLNVFWSHHFLPFTTKLSIVAENGDLWRYAPALLAYVALVLLLAATSFAAIEMPAKRYLIRTLAKKKEAILL